MAVKICAGIHVAQVVTMVRRNVTPIFTVWTQRSHSIVQRDRSV